MAKMAKKLIVLTLGTVLLSAAWMGIVSSVKSSQDVAYAQSLPLKFSVVQSKWARLLNFNPIKAGKVVRPAAFVFTLGALDLNLLDFQSPSGMIRNDLGTFKTAYLDAGKQAPFFSVDAQDGRHLVRAVREGEKVKFIGYSLDSVLNFLGTRLEDSEWFLMDSKNRILAAHQGAYVGQPYAFDGSTQKFKFEQNKHRFTFAIQKPEGASLAMVNFLGVLGIILMAVALFIYKDGSEESAPAATAVEVARDKMYIEHLDIDKSTKIQDKDLQIDRDLNRDLDTTVEDIKMVDLQSTAGKADRQTEQQQSARLDYTEFLIDNPVLRPSAVKPTTSQAQVATGPTATSTQTNTKEEVLEAPARVAQDEWIKMAEELSANIDKFTKSIEEDKIGKKSVVKKSDKEA